MSDTADVRQSVLATAEELARRGLVEGTSGNVSARVDDERICLTPSSLAYDVMTLDDLIVVDLAGEVIEGEASPTTEKSLHLSCYRAYPEIGGVIHSHPVYATMFAVARQPIPAAIEEVAVYVGGDTSRSWPSARLTSSGERGCSARPSPSPRRSTRTPPTSTASCATNAGEDARRQLP